jgi:3-hydroxybutyryl-CoA dehydrogenase
MSTPIKKVPVVGAGTMGQGIAQVSAMAGYEVILYDISQPALDKALNNITANLDQGIEKQKLSAEDKRTTISNISVSHQVVDLSADLIIEAVIEDLSIKVDLFSKLETFNKPETIFASNTSSIPITRIGSKLKHPGRLAGLHFFNPAHIMKLVEVIRGNETDEAIVSQLMDFASSLGKTPVQVADSPGFIVNRVARHFYLESLKLLEEQVADCETIDALMEATGFRMGPFRLMDLIGVDVNYAVTKSMFKSFHFEPRFQPSRIQQQKVEAGQLGRKTGSGFYDYE